MAGADEKRNEEIWWWLLVAMQAGLMLVPLSVAWKLSPDAGHGWAVPLLMGYIYWDRWNERPAVRPAVGRVPLWAWLTVGAAAAGALPLRLFLEPFPMWPAMLATYVVLCAGVVALTAWMAGGKDWLVWTARPMIVLLAGLLWPGIVQREFIQPVREVLALVAAELLNFAGKPAIAFGTSLKLGTGWVGVDEACGGIRSLQAAVMIALFAGELVRLGWLRRAALLVVGVIAALLGNMGRTLFLSWQAAHSGDALAAAHDPAGWIALALTMAGVGGMAWWWSRKQPPGVAQSKARDSNAATTRPILVWLTVWIVCLFGAELGTRWWFNRGAKMREALPQWAVRLPAEMAGFRKEPLPDVSKELLTPDHFEAASWRDEQGHLRSAYYIEWHAGQAARYVPFLHNPTICLPLAGCEMLKALGELEVEVGDLKLPFLGYRFRRGGEEFRVFFAIWDTSRGTALASAESDKVLKDWWKHQLRDVVEARRDQPAQLFTLAVYGEASDDEVSRTLASLVVRK